MKTRIQKLQSIRNICLPAPKGVEKEAQQQIGTVKRAVRRSIVLTMVSSITFLLSLAIVLGAIGTAGTLALIGTGTLLVASVAAALEARTLFHTIAEERRVDHLKAEFISLASHQMRTPLSSLQWYAELFNEEKNLTKQQKEYATEMLHAVRRMNNLIDSLLHAAQLECEEIVPRMKTVVMNTLLMDITKDLKTSAKEKDITVSVRLPKKEVSLKTDSTLLSVICQNLFSNAVKYTKEGGTVEVEMKEGSDAVTIAVTDSGIGIPKKDLSRIFQRLFRASNVLKMDTDGNGLGLYVSKTVAENIGGDISVESKENKGTTFMVILPTKNKKTAAKKKA